MSVQLTNANIILLYIKSVDREKRNPPDKALDYQLEFTIRQACLFPCLISTQCHLKHLLSVTRSQQKPRPGVWTFHQLSDLRDSSLLSCLPSVLTDRNGPSHHEELLFPELSVYCVVSKQEAACLSCVLLLFPLSAHLRTLFSKQHTRSFK